MGSNEVKLVEGYLKLLKELEETTDNKYSEVIRAKMEGIVWGYETYLSTHWNSFESLLERYENYNR